MDKISKALEKLTEKERSYIKQILQKINSGDFILTIEKRNDNTYKF